jgi:hypothetical protein
MRASTRYALQPRPDTGGERTATLLRDGRPVGVVPGVVLDAQFEAAAGDLLFVTHDIPFEEQLEILLLDADGHQRDRISLFGAYTTGAYEAGAVIDENTLRFRFFGGAPWQVRILARPHWHLPLLDPRGVHRQARFRKQLDIRLLD